MSLNVRLLIAPSFSNGCSKQTQKFCVSTQRAFPSSSLHYPTKNALKLNKYSSLPLYNRNHVNLSLSKIPRQGASFGLILSKSRPVLACNQHRRYYADSRDPYESISIEGKTAGPIELFWSRYKYYVLGAGAAAGVFYMLGLTTSASIIGGIASLAGLAYLYYRRRAHAHRTVLRPLFEAQLNKNRTTIENWIGPFEIPKSEEIIADSATVNNPTGSTVLIVRNVFYLDGKYGKAFVRALGSEEPDRSYSLRKLLVDVQDFRAGTQDSLVLVDNSPKLEYVDSPGFKSYSIREYYEMKSAKQKEEHRLEMQRLNEMEKQAKKEKKERREAEKAAKEEKPKLYDNKPKKPKAETKN